MKKSAKAAQSGARRKARTQSRIITWSIALVVIGGLGYLISTSSGVRFDENDIAAVRFDMLNADQKKTALVAANAARCTCGCGMTLAQCVATDTTCPIRDGNIERIKTMVKDAMSTPSS